MILTEQSCIRIRWGVSSHEQPDKFNAQVDTSRNALLDKIYYVRPSRLIKLDTNATVLTAKVVTLVLKFDQASSQRKA